MRNDGAYLEQAITVELRKSTRPSFYWRRLYDTKAARNVLPAQPADFFYCNRGEPYHLEAKSQKGKTTRLKRFSQLPDLQRWSRAGVYGYVLVHFWEIDRIFLVSVDALEFGKPSWVLTEKNSFEFYSVEAVIKNLVGE